MLPDMPAVHVHQILNYYTPREALDPGFLVLDNSSNERPDWYEYWPIAKFLREQPLDEDAFYGFVSPKFHLKTNLGAAQVREFIESAPADIDVFLFSPSIHNSAYYWNVFEHGESEHPGLAGIAARFFARIDPAARLDELVSDSRNTVHSNFFIAKLRFWRAWLEINERLFAIAEDPDDRLGEELRTPTAYRGTASVQMKIFIMERTATWLLSRDATFRVLARDPFAARSRIYKVPLAMVCDALKIAYATQARGQYKDVFRMLQQLRGLVNFQVRIADRLGLSRVRLSLRTLKSYRQSDAR
jgi:hypothetical protein